MKTIHLSKTYPADHLLGQFLDESCYDVLVEEDCDVYKPMNLAFQNYDTNIEDKLLLKFRKNVFSPELVKMAYDGLHEAAVESQNRGIAAGPRYEKATGRDWVTALQEDALEILSGSMTTVFGDDPIDGLYEKYRRDQKEATTKGRVWLTLKRPTGFIFDEWVHQVKNLPESERIKQVEMVSEWISDTQYANPVKSGIAGFFDRYPRIPYCRTTSYTTANPEMFKTAVPFVEAVSEQFRLLVPGRFEAQKEAMSHLDESFRIGNSVYTTLTINSNYRTAAHRDAGDLEEGFGNLTVTWDGVNDWKGGYLIFPAYRVAVNVRPGDMLAMDVHEIHGNTPIQCADKQFGRISIVCYMRQKMADCKTKAYEDARFNFVESRRTNQSHPDWRERWNGISAGMWESEEWYEYLMNNGLHEYADQMVTTSSKGVLDI